MFNKQIFYMTLFSIGIFFGFQFIFNQLEKQKILVHMVGESTENLDNIINVDKNNKHTLNTKIDKENTMQKGLTTERNKESLIYLKKSRSNEIEAYNYNAISGQNSIALKTKLNESNSDVNNTTVSIDPYTPDDIYLDKNGIIYLLSNSHSKIYRWDLSKKLYLSSLPLKQLVISSTYSQAQERIYLGYSNGKITYLELNGGLALNEDDFIDFSVTDVIEQGRGIPQRIVSVGDYLLVQLSNCHHLCLSILDSDSTKKGFIEFSERNSLYYTWDDVYSRVYFSPYKKNHLYYDTIDEEGNITESIKTPFQGEYDVFSKIFVSGDGDRILLDSGDIFKTYDFTWETSLGYKVVHALWDDKRLFTIKEVTGKTHLEIRDNNLDYIDLSIFSGTPLKILTFKNQIIIVVKEKSKIKFHNFNL